MKNSLNLLTGLALGVTLVGCVGAHGRAGLARARYRRPWPAPAWTCPLCLRPASQGEPIEAADARTVAAAASAPEVAAAPFANLDDLGRAFLAAQAAGDATALDHLFPTPAVLSRVYTGCSTDLWDLATQRRRLTYAKRVRGTLTFERTEAVGKPAVWSVGNTAGSCTFQEEAQEQTVKIHFLRDGDADSWTAKAVHLADGWWLLERP